MLRFGWKPTPQPTNNQFTSKFVGLYTKLFQGHSPNQIVLGQDADRFYSDLLDLTVDRTYLIGEIDKLSKDACMGKFKVSKINVS